MGCLQMAMAAGGSLPIAFTEIGDGMSQPSTMAAGLSIRMC
jgi:hypothetical protein